MFIYPIYNHNWRNISTIYITRLASNEVFSPSNKIQSAFILAKNKIAIVSPTPTPTPTQPFARPRSLRLVWFPWMKQDLKGRQFADIVEVRRQSLAALDSISLEDFRQCFQHWERCWDCCIHSQGEYFEED